MLYIGKAGGLNRKGEQGKETLKKRLRTYFSFGKGKDVGHYGGRLIWQIKNPENLIVCWRETPLEEPREVEKELISSFVKLYNKRPFANLQD